jgi:SAM-dependent methyltransferase
MRGSVAGVRRRPRRNGKRAGRRSTRAARADKYDLYLRSVQDPEGDAARLRRMFERCYGRAPRLLCEDFCGTGALACAWVRSHRCNQAFGVDLDPEPLAWGRRNNLGRLDRDQASRAKLVRGNVRNVHHPPVDVIAAFNFSFYLFKTRPELRAYFEAARGRLRPEGLLVLDAYGGPETQERRAERRVCDGFTYVWDQAHFNPINHDTTCFIHFRFSDGSRLERAFRYDWRLWTLPELREILADAGFSRSEVYWEGTDRRSGEPNGTFRPCENAGDDPAWVAYVVAIR